LKGSRYDREKGRPEVYLPPVLAFLTGEGEAAALRLEAALGEAFLAVAAFAAFLGDFLGDFLGVDLAEAFLAFGVDVAEVAGVTASAPASDSEPGTSAAFLGVDLEEPAAFLGDFLGVADFLVGVFLGVDLADFFLGVEVADLFFRATVILISKSLVLLIAIDSNGKELN